jgi:hypothetical protein
MLDMVLVTHRSFLVDIPNMVIPLARRVQFFTLSAGQKQTDGAGA